MANKILVTALHFIVFIPILMQGGVPNYGQRDYQRCLNPVGTALTTAHDTEVRNFGLAETARPRMRRVSQDGGAQ